MKKVRVYHGSLEQLPNPEIHDQNRTLDFGCGFYTTTDYQQAKDWVMCHQKDAGKPRCGYVNVYEIDLDAVRRSHCLWLEELAEDWVDFVYSNRNDRTFHHYYDFVYGPLPTDQAYAALALYEAGLLDKQELLVRLNTHAPVYQLLMHTAQSLKALTFIEAREVTL